MPSRCDHETARSMCLVHVARVGVRVILVDVICVMHVLIARVELHVVFVAIFCNVFVAIFLYYTPRR